MNQIIDLEPFPETRPLTELDRNRERMMQSENKFTRMLAECETIAEIIQGLEGMLIDRDARLEKMAKVQLPPDLRAEFLALMEETDAHFRRHLEPWPDWVVRLAADLWSVQAPTIPKAKILETLRFIHFLVFEFRFYCPASRASFRWPDIDAKIMGAVIGHSVARMEKDKREFSEFLEKSRLSKEKHAEFTAHLSEFSIDGYMAELAPHLAECAKEYPAHVIPFMEGLAIAKANTFDKGGQLKAMPLRPVYQAIFSNWPKIERMSGPAELCRFLDPYLNEKAPDKKLERVKQIRRRLGIVFKRKARGTAQRQSAYLPQKNQ